MVWEGFGAGCFMAEAKALGHSRAVYHALSNTYMLVRACAIWLVRAGVVGRQPLFDDRYNTLTLFETTITTSMVTTIIITMTTIITTFIKLL